MKSSSKDAALKQLQTQLQLRSLRPNTVETYMQRARQFLEAVDKEPAEVTRRDVERYLLELRDAGRAEATRNLSLVSIRTLLMATTGRDVTETIPRAKEPRTMTVVLTGTEVERLLAATESPKYRAIFTTTYGAGLRIGEVRHLRVDDIDSRRGLIHVRYGKTGERYAPLGRRVLTALRDDYRAFRPAGPELFPGGHRGKRKGTVLSRNAVSKALRAVVKKAGIDKRVTPHTFRHSFATHLLDTGVDLRTVQLLLGHACIESTAAYLHLTTERLARTPSPLDLLGTRRGHSLG